MSSCDCKNSRTGQDKRKYSTQSQAELAAERSRQTYSDGDTLRAYYCAEGECWHVGNSSWDDLDDDSAISNERMQVGWRLSDKYVQAAPMEEDTSFRQTQSDVAKTNQPIKSFLNQLMEDAQPAANSVKAATSRVIKSTAVQACGRAGYKGLVKTVGVGLVLSEPAVRFTKRLASSLWKAIEKAGEDK